MSAHVRYCKRMLDRFKAEYVFDEAFTTEFLRAEIPNLLSLEGFEFKLLELKDDTSIFDGGIRLASYELSEAKELIEGNLTDEISSISLYGKYNGTDVCLVVLKDESIITTSCRKDIDLSGLTNGFCYRNHIATVEELQTKLSQEELLKNKFFIGRASDNKQCLVCEDNKWMTFYYERGRKIKLKIYESEAAACAAFYECMMEIKERKEKLI